MKSSGINAQQQKIYLLSGILMFILGGALMFVIDPHLKKIGLFGMVDLEFAGGVSGFTHVVREMGPEGLQFLLQWFWVDYLYPIAYGLFFYLGLKKYLPALTASKTVRTGLAAIPIATAVLDWCENTIEILLIRHNLAWTSYTLTLHTTVVYAKWIFALVMILLWVVAGFVYVKKNKDREVKEN